MKYIGIINNIAATMLLMLLLVPFTILCCVIYIAISSGGNKNKLTLMYPDKVTIKSNYYNFERTMTVSDLARLYGIRKAETETEAALVRNENPDNSFDVHQWYTNAYYYIETYKTKKIPYKIRFYLYNKHIHKIRMWKNEKWVDFDSYRWGTHFYFSNPVYDENKRRTRYDNIAIFIEYNKYWEDNDIYVNEL